ncbi:MAG: hypothetical protein AB8B69_19110, partial [Chitinophagales bacterium]
MKKEQYTAIGLNILVWVIILFWLTFAYFGLADIQTLFVRNLVTTVCLAGSVYFNFYYLLPQYFFRKKYVTYFSILSIFVLGLSIFRAYIDSLLLDRLVPAMPEDIAIFSNMHYT